MACGGMIFTKNLKIFSTNFFFHFLNLKFPYYYCFIDLKGSRNIQGLALIRAVLLSVCGFHKLLQIEPFICGFRKVVCFWINFEQHSVLAICPWNPIEQRRSKKNSNVADSAIILFFACCGIRLQFTKMWISKYCFSHSLYTKSKKKL